MNHKHLSRLSFLPWVLSAASSLLAIVVWGNSIGWQFQGLSTYQIFPVLGLLAFSIMWSQYMAGAMQKTLLKDASLKRYFTWCGNTVLVLILLHPGLLAYQRFHDGYGLPPGSQLSYEVSSLAWVVILGMVSLLVFLLLELGRWFRAKHWWRYITYAGDTAMLAIFYHGLVLGTQTHVGWYHIVWWFYGLSLVSVLATAHGRRLTFKAKSLPSSTEE